MPNPLAIFGALADPTRLRIVALVSRMELAIGELAHVLRQSQPRISRHVKILADAGLIERHREGAWVFIRLGAESVSGPVLTLLEALGGRHGTDADIANLAAVRAERGEAASAYFAAHAAQWDDIRSLHVADDEVEAAIIAALAGHEIGRLVDIGTGTGRMIELLGNRARSALGIDRSPEMLRLARSRIEGGDTQVRQGDMYALPVDDRSADTVILHQVLHYAQQPETVITEAARIVAPGGRLLVVDFAPHDHEELRQRHAHARLGFEDAAMRGWIAAAGLLAAPVQLLTGGQLTVAIWQADRPPAETGVDQ